MKGKLFVFITVGLALVFVSPALGQQDRSQNMLRSLGKHDSGCKRRSGAGGFESGPGQAGTAVEHGLGRGRPAGRGREHRWELWGQFDFSHGEPGAALVAGGPGGGPGNPKYSDLESDRLLRGAFGQVLCPGVGLSFSLGRSKCYPATSRGVELLP